MEQNDTMRRVDTAIMSEVDEALSKGRLNRDDATRLTLLGVRQSLEKLEKIGNEQAEIICEQKKIKASLERNPLIELGAFIVKHPYTFAVIFLIIFFVANLWVAAGMPESFVSWVVSPEIFGLFTP